MTKKKIINILLISILVVVLIILILLLIKRNKESYDNYITVDKVEVIKDNLEVYSKVKISEVVSLHNGIKLIEDYEINTDKIGKIKLLIDYSEEGKNKKGYVEINIVDKTPPYVGVGNYYSHIINTNFTFDTDVICKDNYDKLTKCEIIGDYDLNKLGDNQVKVVAKDKSNNITEKDLVIRVIERNNTTSSPVYKKLEEIKIPENASIMIDVSKWQGDIDWKKVKESGIDYAMMRLGTQKAIDKESVIDSYFEKNIKEARENGVKVGVYYYSYANDILEAKTQAEWVVKQLKNYDLDLPVAFDWECFKYLNQFEMSLHDFNEMGKTFLNTIEKNGYKAINYGSKNYLEKIWDIEGYDTWLAHYTLTTTYQKDYIMWQFTDKGLVPGINGAVDLNFYYNK